MGPTLLAQTSGENRKQQVKATKREPWLFTVQDQISKDIRTGGRKLGSATTLPSGLEYISLPFGHQLPHPRCEETEPKTPEGSAMTLEEVVC